MPRADARGVVICSGNANACTGEQGLADARRMAERPPRTSAAGRSRCSSPRPGSSAGRCRWPGRSRHPEAARRRSAGRDALDDAAHAILTTDTRHQGRDAA